MLQFNKLSEWLTYFESSPRFAMQLGLERIRAVGKNLNLLLPNIPIITVAGTNGKGSTVHALQTIYHFFGYKVGAYTSPHIFKFNERIAINGQAISDNDLCEIFTTIEALRGDIDLTYFEAATLAAMYYFCREQVDIIILEVGMGGRLDATNLWDANLAIITTIDYDHEAYLGNTLESIGQEKAGILRANQLAIYAADKPPATIVEKAKDLGTNIFYFGKDYQINDTAVSFQDKTWVIEKPKLHINAIAAALVGSSLLDRFLNSTVSENCFVKTMIDSASLERGLLFQMPLIGRRQIISGKINLLFDVAHNPQSVALLLQTLLSLPRTGKIHAVFSALKDKNIHTMVSLLTDIVDIWYSAALNVTRAATQIEIQAAFAGVKFLFAPNIEMAFQNAYSVAKEGDWIIVFGSFYVVSAVMQHHINGSLHV